MRNVWRGGFSVVALAAAGAAHGELEARIARIENGLQPAVQIEGRDAPVFSISERLEFHGINGLSVAVVADGELDWAKGYGFADVARRAEVDADTLFLAGSISKPVAALRGLQLAESGAVDLDADVNGYLRRWRIPDSEFTANEKVTLRRILNHTAGLTVWGFPGYDPGDRVPSPIEVLDGKGNTDPVVVYKTPGESWMYSGGGYTVMQVMIEDVTEQDFVTTMNEHVLDPLGMRSSTFSNPPPEELQPRRATGYRANGDAVEGGYPIYPEMAAAGLWTTPSELVKYAVEVQAIANGKEDGVLTRETVAAMLRPGLNNHGLGPVVNEHTFGHGGADEGFRATLTAWLGSEHAAVVMVNSDVSAIVPEVMLSIAAEYELPGVEPIVKVVVPMSEAERRKFVGRYVMEDAGEVIVSIDGEGLLAASAALGERMLLPEGDARFFDVAVGMPVEFMQEEDRVTGFRVGAAVATKID